MILGVVLFIGIAQTVRTGCVCAGRAEEVLSREVCVVLCAMLVVPMASPATLRAVRCTSSVSFLLHLI
jgi:hypothetical protein